MSIQVKNLEIEISKLTPTENNPRQISEKDFESLKKSLKDFPEMKSIREVVVDENLRILGGHMRVRALQDLGETKVYVKQVFGLTEEQKDEFVIRDNVQQGDWDMDALANAWSDYPLIDWGLDEIAQNIEMPVNLDDETEEKDFRLNITFNNADDENRFINDFRDKFSEYNCSYSVSGGKL